MNRRQKKKRDKEAIKLAKKIKIDIAEKGIIKTVSYWDYISRTKRADTRFPKFRRRVTKYLGLDYWYKKYQDALCEYKEELKEKEMLLKVCRKCLADDFPLEEYFYWETPYGDENGVIICFVHLKDYKDHHHLGKKDVKIREIDFLCPNNALKAIPQGLDNNSNQYDCETCEEAVYVE